MQERKDPGKLEETERRAREGGKQGPSTPSVQKRPPEPSSALSSLHAPSPGPACPPRLKQ